MEQPNKPKIPILLIANKHVRNTAIFSAGIKHIGESYKFNAKWFEDFAQFNFFNGVSPEYNGKPVVSPGNLPKKERDRIMVLYDRLSNSFSEVYKKLNLPQTATNKSAPLETKWAFEYYRKFKTWSYEANNDVSDEEILNPLTKEDDIALYKSLF